MRERERRRIDILGVLIESAWSNDAPKRGEASQPAQLRPLGRGKKKRGEERVSGKDSGGGRRLQ